MNEKNACDIVAENLIRSNSRPAFLVVHGSRLYNTGNDESDYDVLGAFSYPITKFLSMYQPPEKSLTTTGKDLDHHVEFHVHEIGKLALLASNSNPTALEIIFSPDHMMMLYDVTGKELKELRRLSKPFITTILYNPYISIYKKYGEEFSKENVNVKKIVNIFRSMLVGMNIIETGTHEFDVRLLSKKYGVEDACSSLLLAKNDGDVIDTRRVHDVIIELRDRFMVIVNQSTLPPLATREAKNRLNEFVISWRLHHDY